MGTYLAIFRFVGTIIGQKFLVLCGYKVRFLALVGTKWPEKVVNWPVFKTKSGQQKN